MSILDVGLTMAIYVTPQNHAVLYLPESQGRSRQQAFQSEEAQISFLRWGHSLCPQHTGSSGSRQASSVAIAPWKSPPASEFVSSLQPRCWVVGSPYAVTAAFAEEH